MGRNDDQHFDNYRDHMILEHIKSKTAKDISLRVKSEQSKTFRMNAMLFLIAILLLVGIYALFYVNSDFEYEPLEIDIRQRISSVGNLNSFPNHESDRQTEKELVVENGFESG